MVGVEVLVSVAVVWLAAVAAGPHSKGTTRRPPRTTPRTRATPPVRLVTVDLAKSGLSGIWAAKWPSASPPTFITLNSRGRDHILERHPTAGDRTTPLPPGHTTADPWLKHGIKDDKHLQTVLRQVLSNPKLLKSFRTGNSRNAEILYQLPNSAGGYSKARLVVDQRGVIRTFFPVQQSRPGLKGVTGPVPRPVTGAPGQAPTAAAGPTASGVTQAPGATAAAATRALGSGRRPQAGRAGRKGPRRPAGQPTNATPSPSCAPGSRGKRQTSRSCRRVCRRRSRTRGKRASDRREKRKDERRKRRRNVRRCKSCRKGRRKC